VGPVGTSVDVVVETVVDLVVDVGFEVVVEKDVVGSVIGWVVVMVLGVPVQEVEVELGALAVSRKQLQALLALAMVAGPHMVR
jgi:hypothetical protein